MAATAEFASVQECMHVYAHIYKHTHTHAHFCVNTAYTHVGFALMYAHI